MGQMSVRERVRYVIIILVRTSFALALCSVSFISRIRFFVGSENDRKCLNY